MNLTKQNGIINGRFDQFNANKRANKLNSPNSRIVWMEKGEKHTFHVAHITLKTRGTSMITMLLVPSGFLRISMMKMELLCEIR